MSVAQTRTHAGNSAAHGALVLSMIFEPTSYDQTIQGLTDTAVPATVGGRTNDHADLDHVGERANYAGRHPRRLYRTDCSGECDIHRQLVEEAAINAVELFPTGPGSIVSGHASDDLPMSLFGPERP
jgi:hypothetical protein